MSVSSNIKRFRDSIGLTQNELADRLGVARSTVTQWENGWSSPRMGMVQKLAGVFGVSTSDIVAEERPAGSLSLAGASGMVPLLVLGSTHAGDAMEEILDEREVEVPESVARNHPRAFMLRVEGNCMNRSYPEGCLVMVDPDLEPWNGCAVVAEPSPGESVLRRYLKGQSSLILVADSFDDYEDMVFTGEDADVRLMGTVVWFQAASEETA